MPGVLTQICIYPVKGLRGVSLAEATLEARGLEHDRRWMLVGPDDVFVSQRTCEALATVEVAVLGDGLRLSRAGAGSLDVRLDPGGPRRTVRVWNDDVSAVAGFDDADRWLSDALGQALRLVWMPDDARRPSGKTGSSIVSFADGYPVLIASEGSLDDLNARLADPVPMDRFRPNLVVAGVAPYAEDTWTEVQIGGARLAFEKKCARCKVTTVDQELGIVAGKEPLRTLATYRNEGGKVMFASNYRPVELGTLRVGDAVVPL